MIKLSNNNLNTSQEKSLSSWMDEFMHSCQNMNINEIESLLEDDAFVNNQSKWEFLSYLRDRFDNMKARGNDFLDFKMERCSVCFHNCKVHLFKGKTKSDWVAFYLDISKSIVNDIV